ncbi:MAG: HDOD domain-containing protein [Pirellulaceae bacterium]
MTTSTHVAAMDRLIDRVERLHSAPHVACEVLRLLQDEEYRTNELVTCLQADPALASSVLRLVNSSYFGLARHVASLQHAVTFLGSRSLRLAVLSFGLLKQLVRDTGGHMYQDFWRRSLTMASVGSRLASRQTNVAADEAYSAGLLADIGLLLMAQVDTKGYVKLYEKVGHSPLLIESEQERYGFHHGELGGRLLHRWNLPLNLIEAVSEHHASFHFDRPLALVTHVADVLADALWTPESLRVTDARALLESHFGLDLDGFITLAIECKEMLQENAQIFRVQLTGEIDCDALIIQARHQYMATAMEAAIDWDSLASVVQQDKLN